MRTAFIIRLHYGRDDPRFAWRLAYFRALVLPRILAQTIQDFEIAVWCNPWHESHVAPLAEKIRVFGVRPEVDGHIRPEDRERAQRFHIDFTYWKDVVGIPPYDLQIGLDSDDLIRVDYLARILDEVSRHGTGNGSLHVGFQPLMFSVSNLTQYDFKPRYDERRGSPFFALYQPDKEGFLFAYEHSHLKLPTLCSRSVLVPEGYCWFTIHGQNASTTIPATSEPILNP